MLFLSLIIVSIASGVMGANVTGSSSIFDDRININTNIGHAHAVGRDGSYSGADTSSVGFKAGILHPGNRYTPLASHLSSKSNTYSSGRRPPNTFANSGVQQHGRYGIKGNVAAGYSGGIGQAYSKSHSQQYAIPLGFGKGVLLSNLPESSKSEEAESIENAAIHLNLPDESPESEDASPYAAESESIENAAILPNLPDESLKSEDASPYAAEPESIENAASSVTTGNDHPNPSDTPPDRLLLN